MLTRFLSSIFKLKRSDEAPQIAHFHSPHPIYAQLLTEMHNPRAASRRVHKVTQKWLADDYPHKFTVAEAISDIELRERVADLSLRAFWNDTPEDTLPGYVM